MSLRNLHTGMDAPTRQPIDIFYPELEDDTMIEFIEEPTPPKRPMRREPTRYSTDDIMNSLSDMKSKISEMTMTCSAAPNRIREEGNKLIQEFNKKYSDITLKEERSFSERAEQIEKQFYEKLRIDLYNLESIENDIKETEERLFKFNTFKRFMFWFGCFTNIGAFSVLLALLVLNYL